MTQLLLLIQCIHLQTGLIQGGYKTSFVLNKTMYKGRKWINSMKESKREKFKLLSCHPCEQTDRLDHKKLLKYKSNN